jgi:methionyl-tRNA formyltransferase
MKLVFMGSGAFALPSLERLLASPEHRVEALFTQPDKPAGRGHRLRPPPTKAPVAARGIPVYQPAKVRATEAVELVRGLAPECIVVVAYGQIIPKSILELPPKGIINVHGSLLPAYRGAAPIQWAIARGETRTGVTTMLMDEGLDTGPVLLQDALEIGPEDTAESLEPKLAELGAELLTETLSRWARDAIVPAPQDDALASLAPRIKKEDAAVDWTVPAREIACRVRAFRPWPIAFTELLGRELKIWRAREIALPGSAPPGAIVALEASGFVVACGSASALLLEEVQVAGKARVPAADFARGQRLAPWMKLGSAP